MNGRRPIILGIYTVSKGGQNEDMLLLCTYETKDPDRPYAAAKYISKTELDKACGTSRVDSATELLQSPKPSFNIGDPKLLPEAPRLEPGCSVELPALDFGQKRQIIAPSERRVVGFLAAGKALNQ